MIWSLVVSRSLVNCERESSTSLRFLLPLASVLVFEHKNEKRKMDGQLFYLPV
jgi:hypothetical protein